MARKARPPTVPPPPFVRPPLPASVVVRGHIDVCGHAIRSVARHGDHLVVGLWIAPNADAEPTPMPPTLVVLGADNVPRAGFLDEHRAGAIADDGERLATLAIRDAACELEIHRDGEVISSTRVLDQLSTTDTETRLLIEWIDDWRLLFVVVRSYRWWIGIQELGGALSILVDENAVGLPGLPSGLALDRAAFLAAVFANHQIRIVDLMQGAIAQAFTVQDSPAYGRAEPPVRAALAIGDGRFAFHTTDRDLARPGPIGGNHFAIVDGATAFCEWSAITANEPVLAILGDGAIAGVAPSTVTRYGTSIADRAASRVVGPPTRRVDMANGAFGRAVASFSDGRLATGTNGAVQIWELDGPSIEREVPIPTPAVHAVAISPTGSRFAVRLHDKVIAWNDDGPASAAIDGANPTGIAINLRDELAVLVGSRVDVRSRDGSASGVMLRDPATAVAADPVTGRFAVAADRRVVLLDIAIAQRGELTGARAPIAAIAWSPSGERIAAGTDDGELLVWRTAKGKLVARLSAPGAIRAVGWLPDDDASIVALLGDGSVQVVHIDSRGVVGFKTALQGPYTALAVQASSGWLAVGDAGGEVAIVTVDGAALPVARHFGPIRALAFGDRALVVGAGRAGHRGSVIRYGWP
jgi:hypothetical protein